MRNIPSAMQSLITQQLGSEPLTLVEVDWATGTGYYADRAISIDTQAYLPRVVSIDEVNTSARRDTLGTVSVSSVTLSDIAGDMKAHLDTSIVEGRSIRVYHAYEGTKVLLLDGVIAGSINWSQGAGTLTLGIETPIHAETLGHEDWPIVFGDCIRVPARRYQAHEQGETAGKITLDWQSEVVSFRVVGGRKFPQNVPLKIRFLTRNALRTGPGLIPNVWEGRWPSTEHWYMDGSFDGEIFTSTKAIASKYDDPIELDLPDVTDPEYSTTRVRVVWLKDENIRIEGLYVVRAATQVGHTDIVNFCYRQEGRKCWFLQPWYDHNTNTFMGPGQFTDGDDFLEACILTPERWDAHYRHLVETPIPGPFAFPLAFSTETVIQWQGDHIYEAGSLIQAHDAESGILYICNLFPSTEVVEVMARRRINEDDKEPEWAPVPTRYFTIDLSDSIDGYTPTTIRMTRLLSDRQREGWEDQIYVSLRSTLNKNTATAIKNLIETYTTLSIDTSSFNLVAAQVENYPSNFVVTGEQDVMQLVQRMAYQSRCVLLQNGTTVSIKYLSISESATFTYTESEIIFKTLEQYFTRTNDIATRHNVTWVRDYSQDDPEVFTYARNEDLYGTQARDDEWLIYNIESLVNKSVGFWGYRTANSWRHVLFQTIYDALSVEGYDTNAINVEAFAPTSLRGTVESIGITHANDSIIVDMHLACLAGELVEDPNFWSGDPEYPISDSDPMPEDPLADRGLRDYQPSVWPVEDPEEDLGLNVLIVRQPESMKRTIEEEFQVLLFDGTGTRYARNYTLRLRLNSTDSDDALSVEEITLDADGIWVGNLSVDGGSGPASFNIEILSLRGWDNKVIVQGTTGETIRLDPSGEAQFDVLPDFAVRDGAFEVAIIYGTSDGTVGVSIQNGDPNDVIYDADTHAQITEILLDSNGNYNGSWYISGGTQNPVATQIRLTEPGWDYDSKIITLTGPYITRNADDYWEIGLTGPEIFALYNGSGVAFMNWDDGLPAAADDLSGIYWWLSGTQQAGIFNDDGTLVLGQAVGIAGIAYVPAEDDEDRRLSLLNTVQVWLNKVIFDGDDYTFTQLPTTDPVSAGRVWARDGHLALSGAPTPAYGIGEIWALDNAAGWVVQQPAAPILHEGRRYGTALSFECLAASGIDVAMTRNTYADPSGYGEVNKDDIEIRFKLSNMAQGTIKGRALGTGTGTPVDLTPEQVAAIVEAGGGGGGDVEEAPTDGKAYARKNAGWVELAWNDITGKPTTFAPTTHGFLGAAHSGLDITGIANGDILKYDDGSMVKTKGLIEADIGGFLSTDLVIELRSGADIIFGNRTGSTYSAATDASVIGWRYSSTRNITLGYYSGELRLTDGTTSPDGDVPMTYKPHATNANRALEFKVKTTWKGTSADLVIDGTLLNTAGKAMAIREIDVCVDGEAKKMLVLASAPY